MSRFRKNQLWLILTQNLVLDGTEYFFKYYGGEAIYWPFIFNPDMKNIATILEKIGDPVVVEAKVTISNLRLSTEHSFGRALVSYFAGSINPNFHAESCEGYVTSNILPTDIIAVHPHKQFIKSLQKNE